MGADFLGQGASRRAERARRRATGKTRCGSTLLNWDWAGGGERCEFSKFVQGKGRKWKWTLKTGSLEW